MMPDILSTVARVIVIDRMVFWARAVFLETVVLVASPGVMTGISLNDQKGSWLDRGQKNSLLFGWWLSVMLWYTRHDSLWLLPFENLTPSSFLLKLNRCLYISLASLWMLCYFQGPEILSSSANVCLATVGFSCCHNLQFLWCSETCITMLHFMVSM